MTAVIVHPDNTAGDDSLVRIGTVVVDGVERGAVVRVGACPEGEIRQAADGEVVEDHVDVETFWHRDDPEVVAEGVVW